MIGNPKPTASLSSSLLARKGHARPAMRPQGFMGLTPTLEDLGWNDMGSDGDEEGLALVPPVLQQREALAEIAVPEPVQTSPVSKNTAVRIAKEVAARKSRAAFTLRLDAERHLRLRLASAVTRQSSQQLVTQALDQFLERVPEVDNLVRQLPA